MRPVQVKFEPRGIEVKMSSGPLSIQVREFKTSCNQDKDSGSNSLAHLAEMMEKEAKRRMVGS